MQMSNEEIARRYRQNKKKSQIETLAQLNDCPKSVIIEILRGQGLIDEKEGEKKS